MTSRGAKPHEMALLNDVALARTYARFHGHLSPAYSPKEPCAPTRQEESVEREETTPAKEGPRFVPGVVSTVAQRRTAPSQSVHKTEIYDVVSAQGEQQANTLSQLEILALTIKWALWHCNACSGVQG